MTTIADTIQQKKFKNKKKSLSEYDSGSESSTADAWHFFGHGTNTKYKILLHF